MKAKLSGGLIRYVVDFGAEYAVLVSGLSMLLGEVSDGVRGSREILTFLYTFPCLGLDFRLIGTTRGTM